MYSKAIMELKKYLGVIFHLTLFNPSFCVTEMCVWMKIKLKSFELIYEISKYQFESLEYCVMIKF